MWTISLRSPSTDDIYLENTYKSGLKTLFYNYSGIAIKVFFKVLPLKHDALLRTWFPLLIRSVKIFSWQAPQLLSLLPWWLPHSPSPAPEAPLCTLGTISSFQVFVRISWTIALGDWQIISYHSNCHSAVLKNAPPQPHDTSPPLFLRIYRTDLVLMVVKLVLELYIRQ